MKLARIRFEARGVNLVCGDEHGLTRRAKQSHQLLVERRDARARVNDPKERDRFRDCELRLSEDVRGDDLGLVRDDAARVHEREASAQPLRLAVDSVARDAGLVADYRAALAHEPVEERRLPNVRPPHNRHERQRAAPRR